MGYKSFVKNYYSKASQIYHNKEQSELESLAEEFFNNNIDTLEKISDDIDKADLQIYCQSSLFSTYDFDDKNSDYKFFLSAFIEEIKNARNKSEKSISDKSNKTFNTILDNIKKTNETYIALINNIITRSSNIINEQHERIEKVEEKAVELKSQTDVLRRQTADVQIRVESLKNSAALISKEMSEQEHKAITHSITIVGIFVAIVAVLFGGIKFVDSGLSALGLHSFKLFILIGVISLVLFDSIVALFYFMGRLTNNTIVSEPIDLSYYTSGNHIWFKRLYFRTVKIPIVSVEKKSKFAFWVNAFLISAIIFVYLLFLMTNNTVKDINLENSIISLIIPMVIILSLVMITQNVHKEENDVDIYKKRYKIIKKVRNIFKKHKKAINTKSEEKACEDIINLINGIVPLNDDSQFEYLKNIDVLKDSIKKLHSKKYPVKYNGSYISLKKVLRILSRLDVRHDLIESDVFVSYKDYLTQLNK